MPLRSRIGVVGRLFFSAFSWNWSRRFSPWNRRCVLGAMRPPRPPFLLTPSSTAEAVRTACGNTTLTACAISLSPPRRASTRPQLALVGQLLISRHLSSEASREHDSLRSKMKLYETPTDEHQLLVIQPEYKSGMVETPYVSAERKLEEAVSLTEAITGWTIHSQRIDAVRKPHNQTFFGKGKIAELKQFARNLPITGVYLNVPHLTPIQHKVLEGVFRKEVFDRFGIVLRIFKERARTKEAKFQVALAEIPYLRARLLEADGHIQQHGITGGGGETHHVAAKRNLHQKEVALREELKSIRERRLVMGVQRKKHHFPLVAIVGYTNSGKTTLIKALSKDESMCPEDMLFATLDTTMHAGKLPCGQKVLYVDTIGFISDLPHELVESFSSTLDDVAHADVLVHIRDLSHPQSYAQKSNVMKVLSQLDLSPGLVEGMVEVANKTDKVDPQSVGIEGTIPISALHGTGLDEMMTSVERAVLSATRRKFWRIILPSDGPELSWLYHEPEATVCEVMKITPADNTVVETTTLNADNPQEHTKMNRRDLEPLQHVGSLDREEEFAGVQTNYLSVKTILTEAAFGKFQANFAHSVRMIEMAVQQ